jgi:hypothetical protein
MKKPMTAEILIECADLVRGTPVTEASDWSEEMSSRTGIP